MNIAAGLLSLAAAGGVIWMLIRVINTDGAGLVTRQEIGFWMLIVLLLVVTLLLMALAAEMLADVWP
jgi:hypothetical protein